MKRAYSILPRTRSLEQVFLCKQSSQLSCFGPVNSQLELFWASRADQNCKPYRGQLMVADFQGKLFSFHVVPKIKISKLLCSPWSSSPLPSGCASFARSCGCFLLDFPPCLLFPVLLKTYRTRAHLLSVASDRQVETGFGPLQVINFT